MPKLTKVTDRNKAWHRRKSFKKPYALESESPQKTFLIVCEGANTEPYYFRSIPAPNVDIKIEGGHGSKTALVKRALELRKREEYSGREVWCVYDMDFRGEQVGQKQDFNQSIEIARNAGMHVAYSNDAFELWLVLHYQLIEQSLLRFNYYRILEDLWNLENYEEEGKKRAFCNSLYDRLCSDPRASQDRAIANAIRLLETHQDRPFADQNPCTTIFQLIEAIGLK
ncbi:MAG: RloB domain-containing protein [Saprospirales bacterium]|nr:RloB domain-containing protein [Saprospirales bacterium]